VIVLEQFVSGSTGVRAYCYSLSDAFRVASRWKAAGIIFAVL
jgi:hypothetical protein